MHHIENGNLVPGVPYLDQYAYYRVLVLGIRAECRTDSTQHKLHESSNPAVYKP